MSPSARHKADVVALRPADRSRTPIASKDFLSVLDLTAAELERVLALSAELKAASRRSNEKW